MSRTHDRREFLKQILATGSVVWLAGRNVSGQTSIENYAQAVLLIDKPNQIKRGYFEINSASNPATVFSLSVASGDPRPNGIVLWTRIEPTQIFNPQAPAAFQIATNPSFAAGTLILEGLAEVKSERDYTIKLPISNTALKPFTTYYYRFIYNQTASRTGRFKTLPNENAFLSKVRFAFVSCQDYANGYYTAYNFLAQENLDFVVHLGDYIYEAASSRVRTIPPLPSGAHTAQTLADYRHLYRVYRSDQNLQAAHEKFAFISIWDDHEFANDAWQDFHPDDNPNPSVALPVQRQDATRAWFEYNLADVPFNSSPSPSDFQNIRNYRSLRFGSLMELVVTDERLYRDGPPCGLNTLERYFTARCAEADSQSRSMLGQTQRAWFIDKMSSSSATWKFWANEVMLMQFKVLNSQIALRNAEKTVLPQKTQEKIAALSATQGIPNIYASLDQWDGYPSERAAILNALRSANVKNLVAITGDIHSFIAGYLKSNFDNRNERPVGVEFVVGSVTSSNFFELISSVLDPNQTSSSSPVPQETVANFVDLLAAALIILNNPHIVFFDSATHGYNVVEVTPLAMTCTMKAVSTISSQTADLRTLQRFVVPRDSNLILPGF